MMRSGRGRRPLGGGTNSSSRTTRVAAADHPDQTRCGQDPEGDHGCGRAGENTPSTTSTRMIGGMDSISSAIRPTMLSNLPPR